MRLDAKCQANHFYLVAEDFEEDARGSKEMGGHETKVKLECITLELIEYSGQDHCQCV